MSSQPPSVEPRSDRYDPALEARIEAMRAFLAATGPQSAADALRLLRDAFPDLPLTERVEACDFWRR